jgi:hypothetical protein
MKSDSRDRLTALLQGNFRRRLEKLLSKPGSRNEQDEQDRYASYCRMREELSSAIEDELLAKLFPFPVTEAELFREFVGVAWEGSKENFDTRFHESAEQLRLSLGQGPGRWPRSSAAIPVARVSSGLPFEAAGHVLWTNGHEDEAVLWGTGPSTAENRRDPETADGGACEILYAELRGMYSRDAMKQLHGEIAPLLRSLFRSAAALNNKRLVVEGDLAELNLGDAKTSRKHFRTILRFVARGLEVFLGSNPRLKRSDSEFDATLRNSMILLSESDKQAYPPVALALSFAGIEAALTKGHENINQRLSQNAAALLEASRRDRNAAARVVKNLYTVRSNVLHGQSLQCTPKLVEQSRLLAAAVIEASMEWREFRRRLQGRAAKTDFHEELSDAFATGRSIVGVRKSAARRLWSEARDQASD